MINQGFHKRLWQGRMEQAMEDIYLDGAHNEDGIRAFLETAADIAKNRECVLLFGAVKEKNYQEMVREELNTERTMKSEQLKETFEQYTETKVICCKNTDDAWGKALEFKGKEKVLFCAGSLYLVGELKGIIGVVKND